MYRRIPLLLAAAFCLVCTGCQPFSFYYSCHEGDDIQPSMRASIGASALQFAREALAGNVDLSYGQLSDDARKSMSHQQFEQLLDSVKPFGPFDNFSAPQILTVSGWGFMSPRSGVAVCSKDSSHPDSAVSVAIKNLRQQAYAVLETKGAKETWAVVLWLIPDAGGVWKVQAFYTTLATVAGKPAGDIVAEARKERSVGHSLNAKILYTTAAGLASRGPFYHVGLQDLIQQESEQVILPAEFRSHPPFLLQGPNGSFTILSVAATPVATKLYLLISQQVPVRSAAEVEQKNRDLMAAFAAQFPEYSDAFAGLVVDAIAPDGNHELRTEKENSQIVGRQPN